MASITSQSVSRSSLILLGILLAVFFLESYTSSLGKSPVWDEPIHIAAGLSYVETGSVILNQQHPPLLKEMSGIFLRSSGVRWPATPEAKALINGALPLTDKVGNDIIADNGPDKVMFWSRLPFILLATGFGLVLYLFGRRLVGDAAALGALLLYVLDPTILAHSYLVTTDMGVAAFIMVFLLSLWEYVLRPGRVQTFWCGLALTAALGSKFSAVALLPIAGILLLAAVFWPVETTGATENFHPPRASGNAPCPCGSEKKYKRCHGLKASEVAAVRSRRLLRYGFAITGMVMIAFLLLQILYLFPKDPLAYITGLRLVNADHVSNFQAYMGGQEAPRFYSYYLIAYLVKEPLATIFLVCVGLVIVVRGKFCTRLAGLFLLVPAATLFAGYTFFSDNIGIRYIIPVLPFTYLVGGLGLVSMLQSPLAWRRITVTVLCAWLILAAVGIYPDHLSYFNEAACLLDSPANVGFDGGSRCGPSWLADSNVDWGQGLKQLKVWLDRNAPGRTVHMAYFGHLPPEAYGIMQKPMAARDALGTPQPGLYVISAHVVAYQPTSAQRLYGGGAEWLRKIRPAAIVGHAYYIYDISRAAPEDVVSH